MDRIEEPPGTFYLDGCILYYIFRNEWAEEDQSNWDDHCEETQYCKVENEFEINWLLFWRYLQFFSNV